MIALLALGIAVGLAVTLASLWWKRRVPPDVFRRRMRLLSTVGLVCGITIAIIILVRT